MPQYSLTQSCKPGLLFCFLYVLLECAQILKSISFRQESVVVLRDSLSCHLCTPADKTPSNPFTLALPRRAFAAHFVVHSSQRAIVLSCSVHEAIFLSLPCLSRIFEEEANSNVFARKVNKAAAPQVS